MAILFLVKAIPGISDLVRFLICRYFEIYYVFNVTSNQLIFILNSGRYRITMLFDMIIALCPRYVYQKLAHVILLGGIHM